MIKAVPEQHTGNSMGKCNCLEKSQTVSEQQTSNSKGDWNCLEMRQTEEEQHTRKRRGEWKYWKCERERVPEQNTGEAGTN